jgi:hypothetical protein
MIHRTPSVLTIRDRKKHSARRRLIGQGMGDAAMRAHEPTIMTHVDELCKQLAPDDGSWSEQQNMAEWSGYLTFDIMTEVVFGLRYHLVSSKVHRHIVDAIANSNIRTTILLYFPKLMWNRLDKKLLPASIAARNVFLKFMGKLLHDRYEIAPTEKTRDILSKLLTARDVETGESLNAEQINADSTTLVIAGEFVFTVLSFPSIACRDSQRIQALTQPLLPYPHFSSILDVTHTPTIAPATKSAEHFPHATASALAQLSTHAPTYVLALMRHCV